MYDQFVPSEGLELVVIRGLPGSGKTTIAKWISSNYRYTHIESDIYFSTPMEKRNSLFENAVGISIPYPEPGPYMYSADLLHVSHDWCLKKSKTSLEARRSVVVANVFAKSEYISPYYELSKLCSVGFRIITAVGVYAGIHGVPPETISKMMTIWENTITVLIKLGIDKPEDKCLIIP